MRTLLIISAVVLLSACAGTGKKAAITTGELTQITGELASDRFSGRGTGTGGDSLAALYIKKEFQKAGIEPFTGSGLQTFAVNVAAEAGSRNRLSVDGKEYVTGADFMPLALTSNSALEADVVDGHTAASTYGGLLVDVRAGDSLQVGRQRGLIERNDLAHVG